MNDSADELTRQLRLISSWAVARQCLLSPEEAYRGYFCGTYKYRCLGYLYGSSGLV
jgi:hypothetical protein